MSKKEYLELLIKSFDLIPQGVKHYRTDGMDGQFEVGVGWMGYGLDEDGDIVIQFATPEGFNDAVHEILKQAYSLDLVPFFVPN